MTLRGRCMFLCMAFIAECAAARPASADDTLALVGTRVISASAFAERYRARLITTGITDNIETRRAYLENLVRDELFILEAQREGLDRTPAAVSERRAIRDRELLNAYARRHILPGVQVTESDLQAFYRMLNTKVRVRHLYAPTKEKAEALAQALCRGRSFHALAKTAFTDPKMRDSGGDLGYIAVDETDAAFEQAAFSLPIGATSAPVKTVQGYSIIRVEDRTGNPFMTEYEYGRSKERLSAFVRKRKTEEASKAFAASLHDALAIRVDRALLDRVFAHLMRTPVQRRASEAPRSALSAADTARLVIRSKAGSWSVQRLLDMLEGALDRQKTWIRTEENFSDYVSGLFMRRFIIHAAVNEGMDTSAVFRETVEDAFGTYLIGALEDLLKTSIPIPDDSLRSYYRQNHERFAMAPAMRLSAILVSDSRTADSVRRLLARGGDFASIARRVSIQKATARRGGDMGMFRKEELGEFGDRIFALHKGAWTGPLSADGKELFVKCTGERPIAYRRYEDAKEEIQTIVRRERWYAALPQTVNRMKRSIECRVYPERVTSMTISHTYP